VAAAYLRGLTQWEIAREEGLNQSQIARDLQAVREEWLSSAVRDFDARKAEELARLDSLEREYREAWERSCRDREVRTAKTVTGKEGEVIGREEVLRTERTEQRDGDPRFLDGALRCVLARCKIFGLIGKGDQVPVANQMNNVVVMTDEERRAALEAIYAFVGAGDPRPHPGGEEDVSRPAQGCPPSGQDRGMNGVAPWAGALAPLDL
jgi:hypothetical protein